LRVPTDSMKNQCLDSMSFYRRMLRWSGVAALGATLVTASPAATVIYTFNAPRFGVGQTTPLLHRLPDSGSSSFQIDFVSSPTATGFTVIQVPQDLGFLRGLLIVDQGPPADVLTMTFNQFVDRVEVNFVVMEAGRLALTTAAGKASQNSMPLGSGIPDGGTLVFTSANPFDSVRLEAFSNANTPTLFAIDNLTLNVVPEPMSSCLVAIGVCAVATISRRRSSPAARSHASKAAS
jgi:hypothetical protein